MLLQPAIAHLKRGTSAHRDGWGRESDPFVRGEHLVIRERVIFHCPGAAAKPLPRSAEVVDLMSDDCAFDQPCASCEPGAGRE